MLDEIVLLLLAKGAHSEPVVATTRQLATELGISQQSFSRRSILLVSQGYIEKQKGAYTLTHKAVHEAKKLYKDLSDSLFGGSSLNFTGKIIHGFSKGAAFMSHPEYKKQFHKVLGFEPYIGTLNVSIPPEDIELRLRLKGRPPLQIEGFKKGDQTFGPILAYEAIIADTIGGAIIFPDRSTHGLTVMELIAPVNLKDKLKLEDGDQINFRVEIT